MAGLENSKVLIVDDTPADLKLLFDYLSRFEFKVRVTQSGKDALRIVSTDRPDIILLDIMMPDMDGLEVCRHLKENEATREIPVIFMSALTETVDKIKGFYVGGVDYITKPFQIEEVLARVTVHLNLRSLQQHLQEKNIQLQQEITKRSQAEATLRKQTHIINARLKELNCLYNILALVEKPGISLEKMLEGIVNLIPPAWQYPEITCVRIILQNLDITTKNFKETPWKLVSEITLHGKRIGSLVVGYLEKKPDCDEGPFLKEEKKLLNAIGKRIEKVIGQMLLEEELRRYRNRLREE